MPEKKEKWSDWIKKWYLAFFVTFGAILIFFESVKAKLQNELNNFIVVPIIHLLVQNKEKYWLITLMLILVLFALLIILSQGSAIAPFIYTIF
jgi:hypothetical protein